MIKNLSRYVYIIHMYVSIFNNLKMNCFEKLSDKIENHKSLRKSTQSIASQTNCNFQQIFGAHLVSAHFMYAFDMFLFLGKFQS